MLGEMTRSSQRRIYGFLSGGVTFDRAEDATGSRIHRYHLVRFLSIAGLYLALGFCRIDHQSLWTDEVISIKRIASNLAVTPWLKSQSPLYFFLLDLWAKIVGTTEFGLRSLSVLVGLAGLGLTYAIGLLYFDRRVALLGAFLLATSPYFVWYAQEVRYVALLVTTTLAMNYVFHRALASRGWRWWAAYGVASALALFTFMTVLFVVVAHGLFLLCRNSGRPVFKRWVASQGVVSLVFAAWFIDLTSYKLGAAISKTPTVVSQEKQRSREKLPAADIVGIIPYTFFVFSVGFSLGPSLTELHASRSVDSLLKHWWSIVPAGALFAFLFVLGLNQVYREKDRGIFILLWLGVPIVGVFIAATMTTFHVYNTRYVALVAPAYLIVLAAGLRAIQRRRIQICLLAALLAVNAISLYNYYFDPRYGRADARAAAQYLESAAQSRDVILAVGNPTALRHYYKGIVAIETMDARRADDRTVSENLQKIAKGRDRLWLVEIRPWETDPKAEIKLVLNKVARRTEHKEFPGVQIHAYDY